MASPSYESLPPYSAEHFAPEALLHEHAYTNDVENGQPRMTIKVHSSSPPNSLPVYLGNSHPVQGTFELEFREAHPVEAVVITVCRH